MATEIKDKTKTPPRRPGKVNGIGLDLKTYKGSKTTLCAGCGHNAISERIIQAFHQMNVDPYDVMKYSGIGCSSKAPTYFLNPSHGFNSVHGRMPSVATGGMVANRKMLGLGVSGDGDTASIGMGQFVHLMRRNLPFIYIIEDNGCYGLTKGQFSATADIGSKAKSGVINEYPPIDTCLLAIELGASFVARSFSGDKKQLLAILKAAIAHRGTAMIDVISPCVTFNDHDGSTKSYSYVQEHEEYFDEVSFVPYFEDISIEYDEGETKSVTMHDGSTLLLSKLPGDYSPNNRSQAISHLHASREREEIATGVFYVNPEMPTLFDVLNMVDEPLYSLKEDRVRPSRESLQSIMESLM